jgi:hypothetical protein
LEVTYQLAQKIYLVCNLTDDRWVPLPPQHDACLDCGWRDSLQKWRVTANILNKQPQTNNKRCPPVWGFGTGLPIPHRKKEIVTKNHKELQTWTDSLDKRRKWRNTDRRNGRCNISF